MRLKNELISVVLNVNAIFCCSQPYETKWRNINENVNIYNIDCSLLLKSFVILGVEQAKLEMMPCDSIILKNGSRLWMLKTLDAGSTSRYVTDLIKTRSANNKLSNVVNDWINGVIDVNSSRIFCDIDFQSKPDSYEFSAKWNDNVNFSILVKSKMDKTESLVGYGKLIYEAGGFWLLFSNSSQKAVSLFWIGDSGKWSYINGYDSDKIISKDGPFERENIRNAFWATVEFNKNTNQDGRCGIFQ